jgi:hypothetical protein
MEAGDCLLTPTGWFHQVNSEGRALGLLMWLYPVPDFNHTSAEACASQAPDTTPLNQLSWLGDDEVSFLDRDEQWMARWFRENAPDHPYNDLLQDKQAQPSNDAHDRDDEGEDDTDEDRGGVRTDAGAADEED